VLVLMMLQLISIILLSYARCRNIIKLKLFPFSLRGKAKDWLLSLPKNSIDSWAKYKDVFIGRYYPPAKIIALHSNIMKFS
jgi:hypothetical protein